VLAAPRYSRSQMVGDEGRASIAGPPGSRTRSLTGPSGRLRSRCRARLNTPEGKTTEWRARRCGLSAPHAGRRSADREHLSGWHQPRRVRRALAALFGGAVGKDTVSRTWRKVKSDGTAWKHPLAGRRADRAAHFDEAPWCRAARPAKRPPSRCSSSSGVRADGQKCAGDQEHGGRDLGHGAPSSTIASTRARRPSSSSSNGAPGLDKAIAAVWDGVPVQRCTVHKHRTFRARAPSACTRRSPPTTTT